MAILLAWTCGCLDSRGAWAQATAAELVAIADTTFEASTSGLSDAASGTLASIAANRAEARNAMASAASRRAAAERAVDQRRALLGERPEDPWRAEWLLDQAEDILLLLLPADGSDLAALFGRPPLGEATRTRALVAEALRAVRESAAERARPRSSRAGGAGDVDRETARRREALLRGIALTMEAEWTTAELATMQRQEAIVALTSLLIDLEPAARRLAQTFLALALSGVSRHDEAMALLRVLTDDGAVPRVERFRAELALILSLQRAGEATEARRRLERLAASLERDDLFARLLLTDRDVLLRLAAIPAEDVALHAPWGPYRALLAGSAGTDRASLQPVALARTATLVPQQKLPSTASPSGPPSGPSSGPSSPAADLPPFPALARIASQLDASTPGADPKADRLGPLAQYLRREDLPALERTAAARLLGDALIAAGEPQQAATTLLEAGQRTRGEPESIDALERAAELATSLWNDAPADGSAATAARRGFARATYDSLLHDLPESTSKERWRVEAGRLALADGRASDVRSLLASVAAASPWWPAASLLTLAADADAARGRVGPAGGEGEQQRDPDQRAAEHAAAWRSVRDRAASLAEAIPARGADAARGSDEVALTETLLLLAESHLALDDPTAALATLKRLPPRGADEIRVLPLRVRALEAGGSHDELRALLSACSEPRCEPALIAATELLAALERRCAALELAGHESDADELARRRVAPLALAMRPAMVSAGASLSPDLRRAAQRLVARGALRGGDAAGALELVEELQRVEPDALDLLVTEAEALARLGFGPPRDDARLGEAMLVLKRIAAGRRETRDSAFWLAETLQLEILKQVGRSTEQIGPRLEQLRRLDPALGGEGFRRRLERLGS